MAQAGYTPIKLYYSTTASAIPTAGNLEPGELGLNIADMKLYCENSSGTVTLLASAGGASGDVVGPASATDNAIARFDLTTGKLIQNSVVTIADTTGDIAGVGSITSTSASGILTRAAATQDGVELIGRAGGTSSYKVTLTPAALSASRTVTLTDGGGNYTLGYLNIPAIADKTAAYTIAVADIGKVVGVGTGGSIEIPNNTFAAGDAVLIFNNTSGDITITCTITTAYIAGTDSDKASVTLATRGVANILFISATACVITGNVT